MSDGIQGVVSIAFAQRTFEKEKRVLLMLEQTAYALRFVGMESRKKNMEAIAMLVAISSDTATRS